ncbi:MAG: porin [Bernardetiaceae bacterium]|nr:porin [Bernardetiaceae bacterium]
MFTAALPANAQTLSEEQGKASEDTKTKLKINGFVDTYYVYDFNVPTNNQRPDFLFNHNRHNEFNLNLGLLSMSVEGERYRANLGLMAGTYAQYNLAHEEDLLRQVFEANAGIALDANQKLWLDAGIFASHLGFESAISNQNLTLTRSLVAENSPYYLAGAKLTWQANQAWAVSATICNGWQRIRRVEGNSLPSIGTSVTYTAPDEKITLNWSTFIGTEDPDISRRMFYFNNLYGIFNLDKKLSMIAGFDFGFRQVALGRSDYENWLAPVLVVRYAFHEKWALAARGEYYKDTNEIIISGRGAENGFQTTGVSLNLDRQIHKNALWRIEGRIFSASESVFMKGNDFVNHNFFIATSLAVDLAFKD